MKKKYLHQKTLFVFFIVVIAQTANAEQTNRPKVEKVVYQTLLQAIQSERVVAADPDIPVLTMLAEPEYTTGSENSVYWEKLQDPLDIRNQQIPLNQCIVEVQASLTPDFDSTFDGHDPFPSGFVDFLSYFGSDLNSDFLPADEMIYYRARVWVYFDVTTQLPGNWSNTVKSIQDQEIPISEGFTIQGVDSLIDNWFNQTNFNIKYTLSDPAGIYKACIWDSSGMELCKIYLAEPDGSPQNSQTISDTQPVELENGDSTVVYLRGQDASYTSESHGEGLVRPENWHIKGNIADALSSIHIKIDTENPEIFFDAKTYTSKDINSEDFVVIEVDVLDTLSGINTDSFSAKFNKIAENNVTVSPPESTSLTDTLTFKIRVRPERDVADSLKIIIQDRAGNQSVLTRNVVFDIYAPELTGYTVSDLDTGNICFAPKRGYTNSTRVMLCNFEFVDKPADRLRVSTPYTQTLIPYDENCLIVDLGSVPESGTSVPISVTALDSSMNEQEEAVVRSIMYDNQISGLSLSVTDLLTKAADPRNGACDGWTNDRIVSIALDSPDSDLYKVMRTAPDTYCRELTSHTFNDSLPGENNRQWVLEYKAGDFAGNGSRGAQDSIILDTDIALLDESQVIAFDSASGNTEYTADETIGIKLINIQNIIPDLSRIIVNDSVYEFDVETMTYDDSIIIYIPTGKGEFDVSCVDFAGNETNSVRDTIIVEPRFDILLSDTSVINKAQDGYTNESQVDACIHDENFDLEQVVHFTFYHSDYTDSIQVDTPVSCMLIDLSDLYPDIQSGNVYTVKARVLLDNGMRSDMATATIQFDNRNPIISSADLMDADHLMFSAEPGYTNDLSVWLETSAQDEHSDIDFMRLSDEIDSVLVDDKWQSLSSVIGFSQKLKVRFAGFQLPDILEELSCAVQVRDKAGNWSSETSADIWFLKQDIHLTVENGEDTVFVSETSPIISFKIDCQYPGKLDRIVAAQTPDYADTLALQYFDTDTLEENVFYSSMPVTLTESSVLYFAAVDSAGNAGRDTIFVQLQMPPQIALTLYDRSEFEKQVVPETGIPEDLGRVDHKFTDEKTVVTIVKLDSGDVDSIRYAWHPDSLPKTPYESVEPVNNRIISEYNFETNSQLAALSLYAQGKNRSAKHYTANACIVYDQKAPVLDGLDGPKVIRLSDPYTLNFRAWDQEPGELAGLVVKDSVALTMDDASAVQYLQLQDTHYNIADSTGSMEIELSEYEGTHHLKVFLVDKADISEEGNTKDVLTEIDHPGNEQEIIVRVGPDEEDAFTNYPNPFNPEKESTTFYLSLKEASEIKITILDAFGNLVYSKKTMADALNDGGEGLVWDGRNENGAVVANGGYICIIRSMNTHEKYIRKIAVLKK